MKHRGFRFYSPYLSSYCTVVFYLTDNHWWFKAESPFYGGRTMKAGTPLSFYIELENK